MSDRPILFSAPMIRAILDGRKTQTRRILKPQPFSNGFHFDGRDILCHNDYLPPAALLRAIGKGRNAYTASDLEDGPEGMTGYYVGDHLWVREAFSYEWSVQHDPERRHLMPVWYWADGNVAAFDCSKPKPSIHMPRWASRLTLLVTAVRVQRLHAISEEDAKAEGASFHDGRGIGHSGWRHDFKDVHKTARSSFARLWSEINGAGSWDANPWVAAISFDVIRANIDTLPRPACEPVEGKG